MIDWSYCCGLVRQEHVTEESYVHQEAGSKGQRGRSWGPTVPLNTTSDLRTSHEASPLGAPPLSNSATEDQDKPVGFGGDVQHLNHRSPKILFYTEVCGFKIDASASFGKAQRSIVVIATLANFLLYKNHF